MREARSRRLPAWASGVFVAAFAVRLGFLLVVDQPLLYSHQYTYFTAAQKIAAHESPLSYVLTSDEWRTWDANWTIAPLYFLMAATSFALFGPSLLPLQLAQCAFDAFVAVLVAVLGRRLAGPRGAWAGALYAIYWPAIEMPSWTMTENAHTLLFTLGLTLLSRESLSGRRAFLGGFVLGISALARAVSSGFIALAAFLRFWPLRFRPGLRTGLLIGLGGAAAILPWTARNFWLAKQPAFIEDAAFENLWWANNFVDRRTYLEQDRRIRQASTQAERRALAVQFAREGVSRDPRKLLEKIETNFRHFLRPEGLQNLVRIERSLESWRHGASVLLDDVPLVLGVVFFCVFLVAAPYSPARALVSGWSAYYLFMVVVVFHNEIRYRSALVPFLFAGAVAGVGILLDRSRRSKLRTLAGLLIGLSLAVSMLRPYATRAAQAAQAAWAQRGLDALVRERDWDGALRLTREASALAPGSARPWIALGRAAAWAGEDARAWEAYEEAAKRATIANWSPRIATPRLLAAAGEQELARRALHRLDKLSFDTDPWLMLEIAWRELPPPRADEVLLAQGDYGAVRGFLHPRGTHPGISAHRQEWNKYDQLGGEQPPPGGHRWSRSRAWVRLRPPSDVVAVDVSVSMGFPFPATRERGVVTLSVNGGPRERFEVGREIRPYTLRAEVAPGRPIELEIEAPTWNRPGEPADQGVRVDRVSLVPVPGAADRR